MEMVHHFLLHDCRPLCSYSTITSWYLIDSSTSETLLFLPVLPDQDSVDNRFGRGIPDALLSCMRDNEIYISVTDSSGEPVRNALIQENPETLCE